MKQLKKSSRECIDLKFHVRNENDKKRWWVNTSLQARKQMMKLKVSRRESNEDKIKNWKSIEKYGKTRICLFEINNLDKINKYLE